MKGLPLTVCVGNVPFIRAWDLQREHGVCDLATSVNAGVTAMCDVGGSGGLVAGFGSGTVRFFDSREGLGTPSKAHTLAKFYECRLIVSLSLSLFCSRIWLAFPRAQLG